MFEEVVRLVERAWKLKIVQTTNTNKTQNLNIFICTTMETLLYSLESYLKTLNSKTKKSRLYSFPYSHLKKIAIVQKVKRTEKKKDERKQENKYKYKCVLEKSVERTMKRIECFQYDGKRAH